MKVKINGSVYEVEKVTIIKKEPIKKMKMLNGKKSYLLGRKDGKPIYLLEPSWDCEWYYGLGYCYGAGYSHTHFDSLFKNHNDFMALESPFTRDEQFLIYELMTELYTLRKYSDMMHTGGAHITNRNKVLRSDELSNKHEYDRINKVLIPAVWKELEEVLKPSEE